MELDILCSNYITRGERWEGGCGHVEVGVDADVVSDIERGDSWRNGELDVLLTYLTSIERDVRGSYIFY